MKLLRVLLVDDEIMIREGFKRLFDWQAHGCEVVGEAADGVPAGGRRARGDGGAGEWTRDSKDGSWESS